MLRRYDVKPTKEDRAWAIVVIDTSIGYFSTVSDWGSYAYLWSSPGMEFRKFLCGLNTDYFWRKITHGRKAEVWDEEAVTKNTRERLNQLVNDGIMSEVVAQMHLEDAVDNIGSDTEFWAWASSCLPEEFNLYEGITATRPEPQSWAFAEKMLPRLQAMLREELEKEKT